MSNKVAAIIVTYNRKQLLIECIKSLLSQTKKIDQIIVVNNNSTDGTIECLRNFGYLQDSRISIASMERNVGGSGGFHEGIRIAFERGFDWLWLMDDDSEPACNTLDTMFKFIDQIGIEIKNFPFGICPKVINYYSGDPEVHQHKHLSNFFVERNVIIKSSNLMKIDANAFVGPLINRRCIEACGLPNGKYFIWVDDLDYTYRISQRGILILDPKSIIYHKDVSPGKPAPQRRYFGQRNYAFFITRTVIKYTKVRKFLYLRIMIALAIQCYRSIIYSKQYVRTHSHSVFESFLPFRGFIHGLTNKFENPK